MEPKYNEIQETLSFPMLGGSKEWKEPVTWEQLISTKGVRATDILHDIQYVSDKGSGFGLMDEEPATYYTPMVFVKRSRLETPEEFLLRREKEEGDKNLAKEARRRQFLSLKAEFEPTNTPQ